MLKAKIKLNGKGVRALLRSAEMQQICMEHANAVQQRAGEGYVVEKRNYPERSGAAVRPDNAEAYYDNLHHNTLLKALGGSK